MKKHKPKVNLLRYSSKTVSYTHLDVYKRQALYSAKRYNTNWNKYTTLSKTLYSNLHKKLNNRQSDIYTIVNDELTHTTHDFIDSDSNGRHQQKIHTARVNLIRVC